MGPELQDSEPSATAPLAGLSKKVIFSLVYIGHINFTETVIVMVNIELSTKIRYDTYGKLLRNKCMSSTVQLLLLLCLIYM